MSGCLEPLPFDLTVDYLAGDLSPEAEDQFEQHLFACADCARAVADVGALTSAIRETIPAAITSSQLERLEQSLRIRETKVEAGQRAEAWFTPDVDLLVHTLRVDPKGFDRVDLEVYGALNEPFMRIEAVPFDVGAGAVHVACQRHFRGEEDVEDTRFRLVAVRGPDRSVLGDYVVRHHWGPAL